MLRREYSRAARAHRTSLGLLHTDCKMARYTMLVTVIFLVVTCSMVHSAQQHVQLSDSYLPVAMQIIAHLTDQMAFETRDDVTPTTARVTTKMTTTTRPVVTTKPTVDWWTTKRPEQTTPFHRPGLYAPFAPPKPFYRYDSTNFLPPIHNTQYTVLGPEQTRSEDPLLAIHHEEVKPLVEPGPDSLPLLPPHFEVKISSRSDGFLLDDISDESLQYLSDDVRDMIKMAKDPKDERVVDVWERAGPQPATSTKAKMSSSNLRLLLLYDLLSRDAKRQRLSDYAGFSPDVMKVLVDSSSGGARAQLRMALDKMVQRKDCGHDYANNRAREMVEELGKDESKLSSELRYLQPLIYRY